MSGGGASRPKVCRPEVINSAKSSSLLWWGAFCVQREYRFCVCVFASVFLGGYRRSHFLFLLRLLLPESSELPASKAGVCLGLNLNPTQTTGVCLGLTVTHAHTHTCTHMQHAHMHTWGGWGRTGVNNAWCIFIVQGGTGVNNAWCIFKVSCIVGCVLQAVSGGF